MNIDFIFNQIQPIKMKACENFSYTRPSVKSLTRLACTCLEGTSLLFLTVTE